jgi:hypothetical protein
VIHPLLRVEISLLSDAKMGKVVGSSPTTEAEMPLCSSVGRAFPIKFKGYWGSQVVPATLSKWKSRVRIPYASPVL